MPRSQLAAELNKAQALKDFLAALSEDERNFILDELLPEPEQVEKPKQTRKPREVKQEKRGLPETKTQDVKVEKCFACYEEREHPNHDKTYLSSHEFASAPVSKKKAKVEKEPEIGSAAVA